MRHQILWIARALLSVVLLLFFSSGISYAQGQWGPATLIENNNVGSAVAPQIAMDGAGRAAVVWQQSDGVRNNVWSASYYGPGIGWDGAVLLELDNAGSAGAPSVDMNANSIAFAVWQQSDGTRYNIWAARSQVGMGYWESATLIETDNAGDAVGPKIAVDPAGNAVAVWRQSDGVRYNIWSNNYSVVDGTWGAATLIETNDGDVGYPEIAIGHAGDAIAVWSQSDGVQYNVWANRYAPGSGWGAPTMITSNAVVPKIAGDPDGNAMVVWNQNNGMGFSIGATSYSISSGWGVSTLIETDNAPATSSQVAMDTNGNAIAAWYRDTATDNRVTNRYTAGVGWGTATPIATNNTSWWCCDVQVAMDINGQAFVVWQQDGIWAKPYTPAGGWGAATLLDLNGEGPQIAMSANGTAMAAWQQSDGTRYNIVVARFAPPPPCGNLWLLNGEHHWRWWGIPGVFIRYFADVASSSTSGTSAGSCSTLVVDRISAGITVFQDPYCATCAPFTVFGDVAFNASSVSKSDNGWRAGDSATEICGAQSQHEALKNGIRLFRVFNSGCAG